MHWQGGGSADELCAGLDWTGLLKLFGAITSSRTRPTLHVRTIPVTTHRYKQHSPSRSKGLVTLVPAQIIDSIHNLGAVPTALENHNGCYSATPTGIGCLFAVPPTEHSNTRRVIQIDSSIPTTIASVVAPVVAISSDRNPCRYSEHPWSIGRYLGGDPEGSAEEEDITHEEET